MIQYTADEWRKEQRTLFRKFVCRPFIIDLIIIIFIFATKYTDLSFLTYVGMLLSWALFIIINYINFYIIKRKEIVNDNETFGYKKYNIRRNAFANKISVETIMLYMLLCSLLAIFVNNNITEGLLVNMCIMIVIEALNCICLLRILLF